MALVGTVVDFLGALEALKAAGYAPEVYTGITNWGIIESLLADAGYVKVVSDSGVALGYTKLVSSTIAATGVSTAGETTSVIVAENIVANTTAGTITTTSAGLGGVEAGGIALTAPQSIIAGVAGICGVSLTWDTAQYLYSHYFGDDLFDWKNDSVGGKVMYLLGLSDGKPSAYINERLAERIKNRLIEIGVFNDNFTPSEIVEGAIVPSVSVSALLSSLATDSSSESPEFSAVLIAALEKMTIKDMGGISAVIIHGYTTLKESWYDVDVYSGTSNKITRCDIIKISFNHILSSYTTIDGDFYRQYFKTNRFTSNSDISIEYVSSVENIGHTIGSSYNHYLGVGTIDGIPGVNKQPEATFPSADSTLLATYPSWASNSKVLTVPTNEDINNKITYVPVSLPSIGDSNALQNEGQTGELTEESAKEAVQSQEEVAQKTNTDVSNDIPTEDKGDSPESSSILGMGAIIDSGLVALYNPTKEQLVSLSRWLWSTDFIDNIKKLFQDPMQSIIGLHILYGTPITGAEKAIQVGYLNSGVNSKVVTSQYIDIDCGVIKVNKYFGDVRDYNPYTKIQVFLPFIGIVDLDTNECIDSDISIKYRIDVLTGSCLCQVSFKRTDFNSVLYTFAGNCAVQLPITGGNYSSIISNTIGVASSIAATVASKGALAPVAIAGAAATVSGSHLNVAHSGSIGSNAGSLGIKKPYLIITRPKPYDASLYNLYYGNPSNITIKLSSCSGFTRVKDVHVENITGATDNELSEIAELLKEGVII